MQYGYFDDENKEYVITRPDTPRSWCNYLGDVNYGALITNNAGGFSFYKSAAQGRFMRFRPNTIPMDQPGRYIYIHDKNSKDFWSTSWQPVAKPLEAYKTKTRHGSAYTVIESEYSNIVTETKYFVPLGKHYECWKLTITNNDSTTRNLRLFTYVEYATHWNLHQDIINLQYSQYIVRMDMHNGIINHASNPYLPVVKNNFNAEQSRHTFLALVGADVTGFDTDREVFIGPYRSYNNPLVVEKGECSNSLAQGDNGCGTLQWDIELAPGKTKEIVILMGIGQAFDEGEQAKREISSPAVAESEFIKVQQHWHNRIQGMTVQTPDSEMNSQLNMWSPFNCLMTFAWSRAASIVYSGERDGLGYRDTVQDMLGVLHIIPDEVTERLELMLTGQESNGGAMPVVKPFNHTPGSMPKTPDHEYRSDDCMWLFNAVPSYVKETGDISFYNKVLPYSDKGEATVLGHLRRAIEFNLERTGAHNLPLGLAADWNDCLILGEKGETVFVAFQLRYALKTYIEICSLLDNRTEIAWAEHELAILDETIQTHAWDGEWFIRAYNEKGEKYGSKENEEGSIWLNPQTWAVYSEFAKGDMMHTILNNVEKRLATEYGVMIIDPPYVKTDLAAIKAPLFNAGMKENGAIFQHPQGWAIIAEAMRGNGENAYKYYRASMPAAYNTKAEIREIEPYVYAQSTHSKYSSRFGASRLSWLTGAATWAYYAATQYILGIQPQYNGLCIEPCIPSEWKEYKISRKFRGNVLQIHVKNPKNIQKGVQTISINGETIEGNLIPIDKLVNNANIEVIMG
ncbi:MAG TPA: hypothetical protein PLS12_04740 [Bacteroidales bacterium]|nr:hypothetical protein [Bacteroidales bacterium]